MPHNEKNRDSHRTHDEDRQSARRTRGRGRRGGGARSKRSAGERAAATHASHAEPAPPSAPQRAVPISSAVRDAWRALGLSDALLGAVEACAFREPTDIQSELIPVALEGRDCLGQAKTGTGKTAAFSIPMLQRITPGAGLQAIVLAPTRELAAQVDEHVQKLSPAEHRFRTVLVLGGKEMRHQVAKLKSGVEILVGTPGRVLDLMGRKALDLSKISFVVLDEVDRMLDIGFRDDIRKILGGIKARHQTIFVTATLDDEIKKLARTYMHEPLEVNVSRDTLTVENIHHGYVTVSPQDKLDTLLALLKHEKPTLAIVFTNTKHKARRVGQQLKQHGVNCKEIHGDLMQERRDRVMQSFRTAKIQVLVATDLASRGLDVLHVSHIINYDIPEDAAAYVHRIGRTGRMGRNGYAVTFVTPEEGKHLTEVEKRINCVLEQFNPPWLVTRTPVPMKRDIESAPAPPTDGEIVVPTRLREVHTPDPVLEAHYGIRPKPRTLGSRFRSARKFRK